MLLPGSFMILHEYEREAAYLKSLVPFLAYNGS
jgi:hypothetical protein